MKYEYNGKTLNIPDDFIQNAMKNLSIDEDEAIQLWLEDNDYEVNEEQMALDAKAKANVKVANIVKARAAEPSKKKTQRERVKKEDPTKEGVIAALAKALPELANAENVTIVNAGKLITFTICEDTYKLDLVRQRKAKYAHFQNFPFHPLSFLIQ